MNNLEVVLVSNITIIILGIIAYYLNSFSNSGLFFGVRIPKKFILSNEIVDLEKRYKKLVIIIYFLVSILLNLLLFNFTNNDEILENLVSMTMIGYLLLNGINFSVYNKKIRDLKEENNWNCKNNTVVVDTSLRKPKKNEKYKALPNWVFIVPVFIPIIITILTYLRQDTLNSIDLNRLYSAPINMIAMVIVIYILVKISMTSKLDINSTNLESTIYKKKKLKMLFSIIFLVTEIEVIILKSTIQLGLIYSFNTRSFEFIINVLMAIIMIGFLITIIFIGVKDRSLTINDTSEEEVYSNDDKYWVLGIFYFNRNDPSFMIEKRAGIGYTVNFGNIKAVGGFIILILFVVLMSKI